MVRSAAVALASTNGGVPDCPAEALLAGTGGLVPIGVISRTRQALNSIEIWQIARTVLTLVGVYVEQLTDRTTQTLILLFVKVVRVVARYTSVGGGSAGEIPICFVAVTPIGGSVEIRVIPAGLAGVIGEGVTILRAKVAGVVVEMRMGGWTCASIESGVVDQTRGAVDLDAVRHHQIICVAIGTTVASIGCVVVHLRIGTGSAYAIVQPGQRRGADALAGRRIDDGTVETGASKSRGVEVARGRTGSSCVRLMSGVEGEG